MTAQGQLCFSVTFQLANIVDRRLLDNNCCAKISYKFIVLAFENSLRDGRIIHGLGRRVHMMGDNMRKSKIVNNEKRFD